MRLWSERTSDVDFADALKGSAKTELAEGKYLEVFETRRRLLNEIETKYSRFLKPELAISLMEIQNNLSRIAVYHDIMLRTGGSADIFEKISGKIHMIVKEVYSIHKMGIEIFQADWIDHVHSLW